MKLLAEGMTAKEVGERLRIREATVRGYLKIVYARLGAKSIGHAIAIWIRK